MIELAGVTKRYGAQEALSCVSFSVPKGQVLGLLGQNGAGKTTVMSILTGYLAPTEGEVFIDGIDLSRRPREAKRRIGYLPEQPPLYDEMTVRDYLTFVCRLREVKTCDIPAHVAEICEETGLAPVAGRKLQNLSKGYRQRAGLAQALCGNPDILVLDEPTVGLDPKQTAEFRELLRAFHGRHTVVFSSHILSEVQALCDRVLILHHGKLLYDSACQPAGGERRIRAAICMGADKLMPALQQLSSVQRAEKLDSGEPGVTEALLIGGRDAQIERELFTLLSALQAPILRLTPMEDSLEDIFLRATNG